jgi:hypothetical protein
MKKAIAGVLVVGAGIGLLVAARRMGQEMREHSEQMKAHCKQMAAHCKQMAANSEEREMVGVS